MLTTRATLRLPSGSVLVEDADEEIFLLYTNKQLSLPEDSPADTGGLGFHSGKGDVLNLALTIKDPWISSAEQSEGNKRVKGKKGKEKAKESFEIEVEVHQSLDNLRNRKGDTGGFPLRVRNRLEDFTDGKRGETGSVLWRLSLHLAKYLLTSHYFPHPDHPSLLPNLSTSSILELGSGTGFLGLALRPIFPTTPNPSKSNLKSTFTSSSASPFKWTFSDQLENLPLVLRNLHSNGVPSSQIGDSPSQPYSIVELDWLAESAAYIAKKPLPSGTSPPDIILAIDCIYNPALSTPLAHTILRYSGPQTVVVVAAELRDSEALEVFLRCWIEEGEKEGWRIARLGWSEEGERAVGELAESRFVTWVGWRENP